MEKKRLCEEIVKKFNLDYGSIILKVQDKILVSVKISKSLKPDDLNES